MSTATDGPPQTGWARLVPELLVRDIGTSLRFWRDGLGFRIAYARPEEKFAYLEHSDGAQAMLRQRSGSSETGPLEVPYGRGAMLQVYVTSIEAVLTALRAARWPLHTGPREVWRRVGDRDCGQREVFVQDPDGYLLMIAHDLGERARGTA